MRSLKLAVLALASSTVACPSGYRLERIEGVGASIQPDMFVKLHAMKDAVRQSCARKATPIVHCTKDTYAKKCKERFRGPDGVDASSPTLRSRLSFIHFSDAQLKEHNIHLSGPLGEAAYDGLVSGSSRNPMLERHDDAAFLATVLAADLFNANPTKPLSACWRAAYEAPAAESKTPVATSSASPPTCDVEEAKETWRPCDFARYVPGQTAEEQKQEHAKPLAFLGPAPAPPVFAIHTGDAVDSGMYSELVQFLGIVQQLRVPFYDVIGNHDGLFFGAFPPEKIGGLNVAIPYVPILDTQRFMLFHSPDSAETDLSLPRPKQLANHEPSLLGVFPSVKSWPAPDEVVEKQAVAYGKPFRGSSYAGFDLACDPARLSKPDVKNANQLCTEARGYYAFDVPLRLDAPRFRVRAIVLNTSEVGPETIGEGVTSDARGRMLPEQLRWLADQLDDPTRSDTYFLVFGHHTLKTFAQGEREEKNTAILVQTLISHDRVLAYVTGHTHQNDIVEHPRAGAPPLVEVIGGSTLVYPQFARLIDLLEDDHENVYLRVLTFRQGIGDFEGTFDGTPGSECKLCEELASRTTLARKGARDDRNDQDNIADDEAVARGNLFRRVASGASRSAPPTPPPTPKGN